MANPYFDIWMRAGETAMRQSNNRLLADIHHAQVEASRRMMDLWFDAWTAPLGVSRTRRGR